MNNYKVTQEKLNKLSKLLGKRKKLCDNEYLFKHQCYPYEIVTQIYFNSNEIYIWDELIGSGVREYAGIDIDLLSKVIDIIKGDE